jgi:hypothetical protein
VLYELLTGELPFHGSRLMLLHQVLHEDPRPPRRLNDKVPRDLDTICMKCLQKEPRQRYASAVALAEDLRRFLAGQPVAARPVSAVGRAWRWCRRYPAVAGLSAAVMQLLVAVAVVASIGYLREASQRAKVETERDRAETAEALATERLEEMTRQKQRAEEETAIARAVNEFLQKDLLGQADTGNQSLLGITAGRNPNITVRELLDRAAKAIEGKFSEQPRTEAAIRLTLGQAYRALGRFLESQPQLEWSVRLRTTKLGADHPDTLESKSNLAELYLKQAKYDRAEPLYKEVLDARMAKLGADHTDTLACKGSLALLYKDQGKFDRAEPLLQEELAARTVRLGSDHPATLLSKGLLADVYRAQGKFDRAEPLFREIVETIRKQYRRADPRSHGNDVTSWCECLEQMQQAPRAEAIRRELADFWKQKAGADSPQYAGELAGLGLNLLCQQKFTDAEPLLRDGLAIREKTQPDAWTTFNTKSLLGGSLLGQQKFAEAEPLLLQGYEGMKQREVKIPAGAKARLTEALERLVQLYDATGQKDKAEQWRKQLEQMKAAAKQPAQP